MCVSSPCLNSSSNSPGKPSAERGTVLVLVLLIVALVAGLSVKFAAQYQLGLARAETRWHGTQARAFLEGTEEVAKLMFPDADIDSNIDYLGEPWTSEVPIEDEGVTGFAKMTDATTQFNLNDLARPIDMSKEGLPERYSEPQRRFIRLLQTFPDLQLDENQAELLLAGVVDWIDADENESGSGGAESNFYQSMKEPYRAANALFKSVDELRLVRGFNESPVLVTLLQPYLTVLPVADAGLNINTLDLVGPYGKGINNLLLCINGSADLQPMNPADMEQFIALRPSTGFPDKAAISTAWDTMFAGKPLDIDGLNTATKYFWLNSTVQLVDQRRSMRSLMMRGTEPGSLRVIRRDDVFELPTVDRGEKDEDGETELVE
ncbi:type II secretion system minor pseudopilin GspK [Cellvibrio fibrivorans]|uniref:General secretion pathway protein K n=1 Tax=Cellvibrio fibrivorans TaxID=126350 RepID=A0ABU1V1J3_9GAMM|nr:type II secretion system minor pseudopilin GspK [Cellvibrio fibrivorans]MDR7091323.1 general secretion pathway protein K [Cellvibrio fibrivorans]